MPRNIPIVPVEVNGQPVDELGRQVASIFKDHGFSRESYQELKKYSHSEIFTLEDGEFLGVAGQFVFNYITRLAVFVPFTYKNPYGLMRSFVEEGFV
ncbi:MAG: hypothetical protein ACOCVY_01900 [Patescibacteria group bacterium]